jgi:hypothetical protein
MRLVHIQVQVWQRKAEHILMAAYSFLPSLLTRADGTERGVLYNGYRILIEQVIVLARRFPPPAGALRAPVPGRSPAGAPAENPPRNYVPRESQWRSYRFSRAASLLSLSSGLAHDLSSQFFLWRKCLLKNKY